MYSGPTWPCRQGSSSSRESYRTTTNHVVEIEEMERDEKIRMSSPRHRRGALLIPTDLGCWLVVVVVAGIMILGLYVYTCW